MRSTNSGSRSASPPSDRIRSGEKWPDNLWCLKANQYLLGECKNEVKVGRDEISKTETGQINNAYAWFTEKYPGAEVSCVTVIPTKKVGDAAGFNMTVTVMRENRLKRLVKNVLGFFREFTASDLKDLNPATVQKWFDQHALGTDALVTTYTEATEK